jgi:2-polyprenyl-3-methyl-5-hydroxy-6-metoxy-1,4-benzoquinol methylase
MNKTLYEEMMNMQKEHWWFKARSEIIAQEIRNLSLSKDSAILDFGSGTGANLEMLKEFGSLFGTDMDESAVAFSKEHFPFADVRVGKFPEVDPFSGQKYKLITALDVIEHIEDDTSILKSLSEKLTQGGYLFITVPAYQWLYSEHDALNHHFRRYAKDELISKVEKTNLKVSKVFFFNSLLFPVAASMRLIKKALKLKTGSDLKQSSPFVNSLLYQLFSLEKKAHFFPFGLSLLLIAKKESIKGESYH